MKTDPHTAARKPSYGNGFDRVRNLPPPATGWAWFRNRIRTVADAKAKSR